MNVLHVASGKFYIICILSHNRNISGSSHLYLEQSLLVGREPILKVNVKGVGLSSS